MADEFWFSQVSELSGQAAELRQQVQRLEKDLREALKMAERKQFEVCVCVGGGGGGGGERRGRGKVTGDGAGVGG